MIGQPQLIPLDSEEINNKFGFSPSPPTGNVTIDYHVGFTDCMYQDFYSYYLRFEVHYYNGDKECETIEGIRIGTYSHNGNTYNNVVEFPFPNLPSTGYDIVDIELVIYPKNNSVCGDDPILEDCTQDLSLCCFDFNCCFCGIYEGVLEGFKDLHLSISVDPFAGTVLLSFIKLYNENGDPDPNTPINVLNDGINGCECCVY